MPTLSLFENAIKHTREVGRFAVVKRGERKEFKTLIKALLYYLKLNEAATLYDITKGEEMIEKKIFIK